MQILDNLTAIHRFIETLPQAGSRSIKAARNNLLEEALNANLSGIQRDFTYCDAPTGTGKTIALTAYAMRVASHLGLSRIVVVLPFLTLCRQTAGVLNGILEAGGFTGADHLAENHSSAQYSSSADRTVSRKWGRSYVVTTSVGLLDSLTRRTPAAVRRLETLKDSVVLMDDCDQWLSPDLAPFVFQELEEVRKAGAHVVLSSATLPHFWTLPGFLPKEVSIRRIGLTGNFTDINNRVQFDRPPRAHNFQSLTREITSKSGSGLVVCSTVLNAIRFAFHAKVNLPKRDVVCITSRLCRADRALKEKIIREGIALKNSNLLVVATSCVEAGWDVSFEWGMREEVSLGSLLQTAGRVNRHGEFGSNCQVTSFQFADPMATRNNDTIPHAQALDIIFREKGNPRDSVTKATELFLQISPKTKENAARIAFAARHGKYKLAQQAASFSGNRWAAEKQDQEVYISPDKLPAAIRRKMEGEAMVAIPEDIVFPQFTDHTVMLSKKQISQLKDQFDIVEHAGRRYFILRKDSYSPEFGVLFKGDIG